MENKEIRLSRNIRILRRACGETQGELADYIGVQHNTVSQYESDERAPDIEIINRISKHYGLPVDTLLYEDLNGIDLKISALSIDIVHDLSDVMFPLVFSDNALEDPYFSKGYQDSIALKNELKKVNVEVSGDRLTKIVDQYAQSVEEYGTVESIANLVWSYMFLFLHLPDTYSEKIYQAILSGKGKYKDFTKKYLLMSNDSFSLSPEKIAYIKDIEESMDGLIGFLKSSDNYAELGDYYLALKYVINMVDNELSFNMNWKIGSEMMSSFAKLGNRYANRYFKAFLNVK